ncbi:synaptic glycoprotein SC2 [Nannizzia gypsea CBS 118893]|uniref:very-long-chain enoyl-CoA reductase n=1 Tax=Arthroderma gypseum (strain ATCC MYA-4604 / CBS 118893) TaxID=535722 RepID=E4V1G6_ARTGP|nr:synaptic glycoprotein SC2 [Nannizzia gypsea CBS 118893]EFR03881.1 synaptic glycoprotein SC2 [Nannizzia gypsea CBS 118893]
MASQGILLEVKPRGKPISKLPGTISIGPEESLAALYATISRRSGFPVTRLRITKGSDGSLLKNDARVTVSSTGVRNQSVIYVKDLGPQIGWRTVFIIEYLGPLIIHPLVLYGLRPFIYRSPKPLPPVSSLQTLTCALLTLHFIKREMETLFVHRFSVSTMPFTYVFRNSAHYWLLGGVNLAYWVFSPSSSTATDHPNPALLYPGLVLFLVGQLSNLSTHLTLRSLRKPGSTERVIPTGFGFDWVTCPNYLFEVMAWVGVYLVSGLNWSVLLFLVVGAGTMMKWASQKEKRYRREFGDKYKKKRFVMLPGLW